MLLKLLLVQFWFSTVLGLGLLLLLFLFLCWKCFCSLISLLGFLIVQVCIKSYVVDVFLLLLLLAVHGGKNIFIGHNLDTALADVTKWSNCLFWVHCAAIGCFNRLLLLLLIKDYLLCLDNLNLLKVIFKLLVFHHHLPVFLLHWNLLSLVNIISLLLRFSYLLISFILSLQLLLLLLLM